MQFKRNLSTCKKNLEKSYEAVYHSPPHVSAITGNILITIKRFAHYHLLASNSTFTTVLCTYVQFRSVET